MKGPGKSARKAAKAAPRGGGVGGTAVASAFGGGGGGGGLVGPTAPPAEPLAPEEETYPEQVSPSAVTPDGEGNVAAATAGVGEGETSGGGGATASLPAEGTAPPFEGEEYEGTAVYAPAELWKAEFHEKKGEVLTLRTQDTVEVGKKYKDPEAQAIQGKEKTYSTGGYYFGGGLNRIQEAHDDPDGKPVVYAVMSNGEVAAYDYEKGIVGGKPAEGGGPGPTQAQAAAVLAGDFRKLENDPSPLAKQYVEAYAEYKWLRSKNNLLKATDAHYAYHKAHGGPLAFGSAQLAGEAKAYAKKHQTKKNMAEKKIIGSGFETSSPSQTVGSGFQTPSPSQTPQPAAVDKSAKKAFDPEKFGGRFESLSETEQWANSAYSPWKQSLSAKEYEGLVFYKGYGYSQLNGTLRKTGGDVGGMPEPSRRQVEQIDSAIGKAPPLAEPMVVYRGRMPNEVCEAFKGGRESDLIGRTVGDEAYMSTSFSRGVGTDFSNSNKYAEASIGKLTLPKGTKAAHLDSISSMNEAEMLLPRGSKFLVTNAYKKDGKNCVDAVLVLP